MSNKNLLFFFLLLNSAANAQPLTINWMDKKADTYSEFIRKDSQGNIIVVGRLKIANPSNYMIVYKYTNSGTLLWQKKFLPQFTNCLIRAFDVEIDSLDNIYVAGTINFNCTNSDEEGFLRKYNAAGTALWTDIYGGNAGLAIEFKALEIFQNKYILVAGNSYTLGTGNPKQGFVARYDSSGSQNWTRTLSNNYETNNSVLVLDNLGNAYIAGRTSCCFPGYDMFLYKCDSLGNTKWYLTVLDTAIVYAYPTLIAIDDSANVYLAGSGSRTHNFNGIEFTIAKVDSSGSKKWYTIFTDSLNNGFDYPHALCIDKSGNSYIAGTTEPLMNSNINGLAAKVSSTGNVIWKDTYEGPAHDDDGYLDGFLLNDSNFIALGGGVFTPTSGGILFRNYKSNGTIVWTYENNNQCVASRGVLIDSSIYCTGSWHGIFVSDSLFTCRIDLTLVNGIPKHFLDNTFNAFPNPFSDIITITSMLKNCSNKDIFITDMLGKKIYEAFEVSMPLTINLNKIRAGLYLLQIRDKEGIENSKILKY
jgi:Secretion system C-terminal sorting domain